MGMLRGSGVEGMAFIYGGSRSGRSGCRDKERKMDIR